MEYSIDGLQVNMTALNETMSQVSRHYHTKSFVQYAYWLIALLQVSVSVYLFFCLSVCLLIVAVCFAPFPVLWPGLISFINVLGEIANALIAAASGTFIC